MFTPRKKKEVRNSITFSKLLYEWYARSLLTKKKAIAKWNIKTKNEN